MYVPAPNRVDDAGDHREARSMVAAAGRGHLVTNGPQGPLSTLLPLLWEGDTVAAHFAIANDHWRAIAPDSSALVVVPGPDAYVSPGWYPSKAEHGRVVPTWNYTEVQLRGRATTYDDPERLLALVTRLTDRHEDGRAERWRVTDAPEAFVRGQLRAIIGVEIVVDEVHAKAKLSQNRSMSDRQGVLDGLAREPGAGAAGVREAMISLPE